MEYDENRLNIATDIGHRFLNIISDDIRPQHLQNGSEHAGDEKTNANNLAATTPTAETDICNKTTTTTTTGNNINITSNNCSKLKLNNTHDTRNHNGANSQQTTYETIAQDNTTTHNEIKGGDIGGGDVDGREDGGGGGGGDNGIETIGKENNGGTSPSSPTGIGTDELVLDVLNDDLIARVRDKINGGSKELFEPCVLAVKSFLAGEPFREFETSMYFYR